MTADSLRGKPAIPGRLRLFAAVALALTGASLPMPCAAEGYRRLTPLPAPRIVAASEELPGGNAAPGRALDGNPKTDFVSNGKGVGTFLEFDFGAPVRIGGFRHQERNDPATVAASELIFSDASGATLATVPVAHAGQRTAVTSFALPEPVKAQRVRWQVTKLGGASPRVGAAEIVFFAASDPEPLPKEIAIEPRTVQVLDRKGTALVQPLRLAIDYPYAPAAKVVLHLEGQDPRPLELRFGSQTVEYTVAAADVARSLKATVELGGVPVVSRPVAVTPARKLTVYVLPHSHTDIGYTATQTDIEEKQIDNLLQGMAAARRTAAYPEGARFVWNVEVAWAADLFLSRLGPAQRADLLAAVRRGEVAIDGMYLNELTGLCRPAELMRLFRYATQLGARTGVPIDSAMISDVPGYTWGTVPAMAQAGIRYFSVAPNYFDRIGDILVQWENKPFWWMAPDGESKVLVWIPYQGYGLSHRYPQMSTKLAEDIGAALDARAYPYDIAYVRWAGRGDNGAPDPAICEFIRDWNKAHAFPRFVISSTSRAFRAFENRFGDKLPRVRGDWTPYWEDGAGSSAAETAANRASSERLAQAETLWAMLAPRRFPAQRFEEAWRNVLLYSEHTWGASSSISQPAGIAATEQWRIKQSYAGAADLQSRELLGDAGRARGGTMAAVGTRAGDGREKPAARLVDVFNTTSWPRTGLVSIPREITENGNLVFDDQGRPVPAQRLAGRELAVLVRDLPPFSGRRYAITTEGAPAAAGTEEPKAAGNVIENGRLRVRLDPATGGIVELRARGIDANLADEAGGRPLNEYLYLIGEDVAALRKNGPVTINVRERGPLVASLLVESEAPGCHRLSREIRLTAGADHLELFDTVDKKRLEAQSYHAKEGKESVNFAFPFHVPGGQVRLDLPLAAMRPEADQIASACKNWLTVGRWADVSNDAFGVTLVTLDAPLLQVGGITATLLNSQTDPAVWRKKIDATQALYVWAMNNHWGTNYRAYQEGAVMFRFVLRPHGRASASETSRFATEFSQPLVAVPARGSAPEAVPLLRVESSDVLVTELKPSDDRRAWIVRLASTGNLPVDTTLAWAKPGPRAVWLSDTSERPRRRVLGLVRVPAGGVVTLRAEMPR